MGFAERYVNSLNSSNLKDDEFNHNVDPLAACAMADIGVGLGSLLTRIRYAGKMQVLPKLLLLWELTVIEKGLNRKWVKVETERDIKTANALYSRIAHKSLAYWLDDKCKPCGGTGIKCNVCRGTKKAEIECSAGYEKKKILEMVCELDGILESHNRRATCYLK